MSAAVKPPGPPGEEIVQESARWQALVQKKQITANRNAARRPDG